MKSRKLRNLLEFKDRNQVRALLCLASGLTREAEINELLLGFIKDQKKVLHGFYEGQMLSGLIALQLLEKKQAEIMYIAVREEEQGRGLGTELISMAKDKHKLKTIYSETDSGAKIFYEKNGFELRETFENSYGAQRFKFLKTY